MSQATKQLAAMIPHDSSKSLSHLQIMTSTVNMIRSMNSDIMELQVKLSVAQKLEHFSVIAKYVPELVEMSEIFNQTGIFYLVLNPIYKDG